MIINFIYKTYNKLNDLLFYIKYFIYFNFFIAILINNIIYYKLFKKSNYYLIQILYYSIKLNGCVLIKFIQWLTANLDMLEEKEMKNILKIFSN